MGSGFSKFTSGAGSFFKGVLGSVPQIIQGASMGGEAGPWGAVAGGLAGLAGGVAQGVDNVINASKSPAGPASLGEVAAHYGPQALDLARSVVNSDVVKEGLNQGKEVLGNFVQHVANGHNWRQAAANAGVTPFLTAQAGALSTALTNKMAGISGVDPKTALTLGNPWLRTIAARTGMNTVHRQSAINQVLGHAHSLAASGLGHLIGRYAGNSGGAMPMVGTSPAEAAAPPAPHPGAENLTRAPAGGPPFAKVRKAAACGLMKAPAGGIPAAVSSGQGGQGTVNMYGFS